MQVIDYLPDLEVFDRSDSIDPSKYDVNHELLMSEISKRLGVT